MGLRTLYPEEAEKYMYRYVDCQWDSRGYRLETYPVIRETEHGCWIDMDWDMKKFVYKTGRNNFAKQTREEALVAYMHRKRKHVAILESDLRMARWRLDQVRKELHLEPKEEMKAVEELVHV